MFHRRRERIVKASYASKIRNDISPQKNMALVPARLHLLIAVDFLPFCEKDLRQALQAVLTGKT
jgi:hypothetical protein